MAGRRDQFLCVLALVLSACGAEPTPSTQDADRHDGTIDVRVLDADLARGATACLLPDGRAMFILSHLGGGTTWLGTWTEEQDTLTITLPRMQAQLSTWSAPEDATPPDEVVLHRTGEATWTDTRRTIEALDTQAVIWNGQTAQWPRRAVPREYRFTTLEEHDEMFGPHEPLDRELFDAPR